MDNAQALRKLASASGKDKKAGQSGAKPIRTFTVTSGKGGVGKTNIVVNLACTLAAQGYKVLILDADLGLANVDVVLGLNPLYTLADVVKGGKGLDQIMVEGPRGIKILPASSGVAELSNLSGEEKLALLHALDAFETDADVVLIDTAAGIGDTVIYFNLAAQERIVVATAEPTSLTDAYALIKVLYTEHGERRFRLLVNNVEDMFEAKQVYRKLAGALDRFLDGLSIDFVGYIPRDRAVNRAVMKQTPLVELYPDSEAALSFAELARTLMRTPVDKDHGNIKFFWRRLVELS